MEMEKTTILFMLRIHWSDSELRLLSGEATNVVETSTGVFTGDYNPIITIGSSDFEQIISQNFASETTGASGSGVGGPMYNPNGFNNASGADWVMAKKY